MICQGCGGVVGRDCFNPSECLWISQQQQQPDPIDNTDYQGMHELSMQNDFLSNRVSELEAQLEATKNKAMNTGKTAMDFKDEFKLWLQSREYDAILNHVAIDRLVRHVETEYIIPLKSEAFTNLPTEQAATPKTIDEIGVIALRIAETVTPKLSAQEQALFIAGFQECFKWQSLLPTERAAEQVDRWIPVSDAEIEELARREILYNDTKRNWWIEGVKYARDHFPDIRKMVAPLPPAPTDKPAGLVDSLDEEKQNLADRWG